MEVVEISYLQARCLFHLINESNAINGSFQQSLIPPHVTIIPFTLTVLSLLIGLMGLLTNSITLKVCANSIMWKRAYSRFLVTIAYCDILFIISVIVATIPTIIQYFNKDFYMDCSKVAYYLFGLMRLFNMAAIYLVLSLGYEKLCLIADPFEKAGWSLLQKALYSTKKVAVTLVILVCINLPRFWMTNVSANISKWISCAYVFLDTLIPLIVSVIFGICIWKKYCSHEANRTEKFPNIPKKRSTVEGAIVLLAMNTIAVGFSLSSFLVFVTNNSENFVSPLVVYTYHFSIFVFVVNASTKFIVHYYWGTYFVKAFDDTRKNCKFFTD